LVHQPARPGEAIVALFVAAFAFIEDIARSIIDFKIGNCVATC
jgi:hypothetical protein